MKTAAALTAVALLAPTFSSATPIAYDSFSGTTLDFDGLAGSVNLGEGEVLGSQFAGLGVTFSVPNFSAYASTSVASLSGLNSDPNVVWVDQNGGGSDLGKGVVIDFANAQSSVGLWLWGSRTSSFTLAVYNGDTLLESITSPLTDDPYQMYPEGFLAVSNTNITRAVVFSTSHRDDIPFLTGTNWNFAFDDLKFAGPPVGVPEPDALGLMGAGIAALFLFRRRRIA